MITFIILDPNRLRYPSHRPAHDKTTTSSSSSPPTLALAVAGEERRELCAAGDPRGHRRGSESEGMEQRRPAAAPGKPQRRRRLSATESKVAEASSLVGGIVEKGFSGGATKGDAVTAPPMPAVVPFPVARHRSDGPVSFSCFFVVLIPWLVGVGCY